MPPFSKPHPVDVHVGARLRLRRKLVGLSQQKLAQTLGVTFQQVQKYERGTNRMSASALHQSVIALKIPIAWLFEGLPPTDDTPASPHPPQVLMATREGLAIAQLLATATPRLRVRVLDVLRAASADGPLETI